MIDTLNNVMIAEHHPQDVLLRGERLPHIWCPGCGLGAAMACYERAIAASGIPVEHHVCVSGIGCTGRIAGYVKIDSYHTTHGRPVPFATGMHIANPDLEVTVFTGDGDLATIGGNHLIHAIRRNVDINIFCVNNFTYGMTGGQFGATTPRGAITATTPYGNFEGAFNLPDLAASLGAPFVARWTTLHVRQLEQAMERSMQVDGIAFIEILSPCPPGYGKWNRFREGIDQMKYYREHCIVDHSADTRDIEIDFQTGRPTVLGNFVDRDRPSYLTVKQQMLA
ncbi:MAG: thiamine pyrophosphate-dependent enzyme [Anaerolineae bacterium]